MKTLVFALWIVTNIVAVCDEQSRWPTAMVPTHNAEPTTQAERLSWLAHREAMKSVAARCDAVQIIDDQRH